METHGQYLYHPETIEQTIEAVKLLADWAKWLITIETTAVAAIAFSMSIRDAYSQGMARAIGAFAMVFFTISIIFATLLFRSLPGVMQAFGLGRIFWVRKIGMVVLSDSILSAWFFWSPFPLGLDCSSAPPSP